MSYRKERSGSLCVAVADGLGRREIAALQGKSPRFAKARRVGKIRWSARLCGRKDLEILRFGNSNPPALTSLVNIFRSLLAGEAYEEEAKKPSIEIIDAQEEHAEADEKKESGKNRAR